MPSLKPQPSPAYFLTLALGCTGIAFSTMALWAIWQVDHSRDPIDGVGTSGAIGMILTFSLMYFTRLITWNRVSESNRRRVQKVVAVVLFVALVSATLSLVLSLTVSGRYSGLGRWLSVMACMCQLPAAMWLFKYQRQTA